MEELSGLVHMSVRLTSEQQRALRDDPKEVKEAVSAQVETALKQQAIIRLLGAVERRLEESLELDPNQLAGLNLDLLEEQVTSAGKSVREAEGTPGGRWRPDWQGYRRHSVKNYRSLESRPPGGTLDVDAPGFTFVL
jgi:small-conductance mechanosensitive channel